MMFNPANSNMEASWFSNILAELLKGLLNFFFEKLKKLYFSQKNDIITRRWQTKTEDIPRQIPYLCNLAHTFKNNF